MITNLNELYDKLTEVVNTLVERAAQNTTTGNWVMGYDDVAQLITEEDFNRYYSVIAGELAGREEILDVQMDSFEGTLDVIVGLDYCPNYEPQPEEDFKFGTKEIKKMPALSEQLGSESKLPDHLIELSCYADQVLPTADPPELVDDYNGAQFIVPKAWAEEKAKQIGYKDLEDFLDNYTWDNTDGWYADAFKDHVLCGANVIGKAYDAPERSKTTPAHEEMLQPSSAPISLSHVTDVSYERLLCFTGGTTVQFVNSEEDYQKAGFTDCEIFWAQDLKDELQEISNVNTRPAMIEGKPCLVLCCSFDEAIGLPMLGRDQMHNAGALAEMKAAVLRSMPELKDLNISVGHKTGPGFHNEVAVILPLGMSNYNQHAVCEALKGYMYTFSKEEQDWIECNNVDSMKDMARELVRGQTHAGYYDEIQKRQLDLYVDEITDEVYGKLFSYWRDELDMDIDELSYDMETDIYDHVIHFAANYLECPVGVYTPDPNVPNQENLHALSRGEVLEAMRATKWPNMSVDLFLSKCSHKDAEVILKAIQQRPMSLDDKLNKAKKAADAQKKTAPEHSEMDRI